MPGPTLSRAGRGCTHSCLLKEHCDGDVNWGTAGLGCGSHTRPGQGCGGIKLVANFGQRYPVLEPGRNRSASEHTPTAVTPLSHFLSEGSDQREPGPVLREHECACHQVPGSCHPGERGLLGGTAAPQLVQGSLSLDGDYEP